METTHYTLIFIKKCNKMLLGFKKRGFGKNTWNGYGGKLYKHESAVDCVIRELHEESNLIVSRDNLNYLGVVVYRDVYKASATRIVHIFTADETSDSLQESDEMRPKWFEYEKIPFENMWPDCKYWLPLVLRDCYFYASFTYKNDYEVIDYDVRELQAAPEITDEFQTIQRRAQ